MVHLGVGCGGGVSDPRQFLEGVGSWYRPHYMAYFFPWGREGSWGFLFFIAVRQGGLSSVEGEKRMIFALFSFYEGNLQEDNIFMTRQYK